ncbi:MAG: 30S ribosomal protein S24e [Candidatus Micrarchaeota archaeon]|nr:30S ribosomal protein S24e [Candidatus Micrarchaeota archaeon]
MTLEIVSETDNKLFGRKEVCAKFTHIAATPSRKDAVEALAEKFGHKDSIVIDEINQRFGRKEADVLAKIYDSPEQAKSVEPKHRFTRGQPKAKKEGA